MTQEQYGYKVVLDKQKWLRGEEACKMPYLLEPKTSRYDAAAKIMLDMGYSTSMLRGKRWPCQVIQALGRNERIFEQLRWMVSKAQADTEQCVELITVNDDPRIDDDTRIKRIQAIINPHNIGLIVTDSSIKVELPKETADSPSVVSRLRIFDEEMRMIERAREERLERERAIRRRQMEQERLNRLMHTESITVADLNLER